MSDQSEFGKWFQKATKEEYDPFVKVEYTEWEVISEGAPSYSVGVVFTSVTGVTGKAFWERKIRVKERRFKITKNEWGEVDPICRTSLRRF